MTAFSPYQGMQDQREQHIGSDGKRERDARRHLRPYVLLPVRHLYGIAHNIPQPMQLLRPRTSIVTRSAPV